MKKNLLYHKPVMVNEVLEYLNPQSQKLYVDVTFGSGGHTRAILKKNLNCRVVALDWDKNAIEKNGPILQDEFPGRLTLLWGNFGNLYNILKKEKISNLDGILADFGTSQYQISELPGFSIYKDTFLDMRMSPAHQKTTAYEIVNKASKENLEKIFFELGEERFAKKISQAIVDVRKQKNIKTTGQLVDIIENVVSFTYKNGKRKIHPATKVFQALRIYINNELDNIKSFLSSSLKLLAPGGKLVCISFHSLEDRIVKQFIKDNPCLNGTGFKNLTPKIVTPTEEEIRENSSSRSAKLRAAEFC